MTKNTSKKSSIKIQKLNKVYDLMPWFHDFSTFFNIETRYSIISPSFLNKLKKIFRKIIRLLKFIFQSEFYIIEYRSSYINQKNKQEFIIPFLFYAANELNRQKIGKLSLAEFFCSDGFYSMWCKNNLDIDSIIGYDFDERSINQANLMKKILKLENIEFVLKDIHEVQKNRKYNIVLNAGGLYHIKDPKKIIKLTHDICSNYAIIQTVITEKTEDPNYFESPAPGWKHGCRFTQKWLEKQLKTFSWEIIFSARNILQANVSNLHNSGSVYYLLKMV